MKKIISAVLVLVGLVTVNSYAKDPAGLKFSLVPTVETPKTTRVYGFDFGLLATQTPEVQGAQLGIFYAGVSRHSIGVQWGLYSKAKDFDGAKYGFVSVADNMRGYNSGFVCITKDFIGYQQGFVAVNSRLTGVQFGGINVSDEVSGLQVGFINYTRVMNGVQVGLINIIKESSLPVMVIVNAKFK